MKVHEYQAKDIFRRRGIPVPKGYVAETPGEVRRAFLDLGGGEAAVKAQIHSGGRGKAGGVRIVSSPDAAEEAGKAILGMRLVTTQTGPAGKIVRRVLVEKSPVISREYYAGVVVDRTRGSCVLMASAGGGIDIEEVARRNPAAIFREYFGPDSGIRTFQVLRLVRALGVAPAARTLFDSVFKALCRIFVENHLTLVEINPLVLTADGTVVALDGKVDVDDNALFLVPDVVALRDETEEDPLEVEAGSHHLNYIRLDGEIGCLVNGAGLAMATMDAIQMAGGRPANFLDVGGGASRESVSAAFRIILSDSHVKGILVNIFGGIVQCDTIARGIVEAVRDTKLATPLVVRLEGTNVEDGRKILAESRIPVVSVEGMTEAAARMVELVYGRTG
ncbi:MAG: ADP-forming succinate--CoA ligase subunit beta [Planctomycetota bacterium]